METFVKIEDELIKYTGISTNLWPDALVVKIILFLNSMKLVDQLIK